MICAICKIDQKRPRLATLTRKLATVPRVKEKPIVTENATLVAAEVYCGTKLPLHEMTIQEKLAAVEALWEDLSRDARTSVQC